jgi:hypothetical protein
MPASDVVIDDEERRCQHTGEPPTKLAAEIVERHRCASGHHDLDDNDPNVSDADGFSDRQQSVVADVHPARRTTKDTARQQIRRGLDVAIGVGAVLDAEQREQREIDRDAGTREATSDALVLRSVVAYHFQRSPW